jgi:hypothetical protein
MYAVLTVSGTHRVGEFSNHDLWARTSERLRGLKRGNHHHGSADCILHGALRHAWVSRKYRSTSCANSSTESTLPELPWDRLKSHCPVCPFFSIQSEKFLSPIHFEHKFSSADVGGMTTKLLYRNLIWVQYENLGFVFIE